MKSLGLSRYALTSCAAIALLAGCGESQPPIGMVPQSRAGVAHTKNAQTGHVYVGFDNKESLYQYGVPNRKNHRPTCEHTSLTAPGTDGISVNEAHILYVPDENTGRILTFGPSCHAQAATNLVDPKGKPFDVAFDNQSDTVFVSDIKKNCVEVYEHGSASPTRQLCSSSASSTSGVSVDANGNVYQSSPGNSTIIEFPHGREKGNRPLPLTGLSKPDGLEFDLQGNLIVTDYDMGVLIYANPFKGPPDQYIATGPAEFAKLDSSDKHLYVALYGSNTVMVYTYPQGVYEYSISKGLPNGVDGIAVDPPSGT